MLRMLHRACSGQDINTVAMAGCSMGGSRGSRTQASATILMGSEEIMWGGMFDWGDVCTGVVLGHGGYNKAPTKRKGGIIV